MATMSASLTTNLEEFARLTFGVDYNGFLYEWLDSSNGMKYRGSHFGRIDDGYIGGGKRFNRAFKKRKWEFSRTIVSVHFTASAKELREKFEQPFLDDVCAGTNPIYYNISMKASGSPLEGYTKETSEMVRAVGEKVSRALTGRVAANCEYLKKMAFARTGWKKETHDCVARMAEKLKENAKKPGYVNGGGEWARGKTSENCPQIARMAAANAKTYFVKFPPEWGDLIIRVHNLSKFERDMGFVSGSLRTAANTGRRLYGFKAWHEGESEPANPRKPPQAIACITDPSGVVHIVHGVAKFCAQNNLNQGAMGQVLQEKARQHKGYTGYYIVTLEEARRAARGETSTPILPDEHRLAA